MTRSKSRVFLLQAISAIIIVLGISCLVFGGSMIPLNCWYTTVTEVLIKFIICIVFIIIGVILEIFGFLLDPMGRSELDPFCNWLRKKILGDAG